MIAKTILGLIVALIVVFVLVDGTFLPSRYNGEKDIYDAESDEMTELQFSLIKAGMGAGSSHNMQPWKIQVKSEESFALYADMEKNLDVVDASHNQLLMSQGTYIEKVKQAAKDAGIALKVNYEPIDFGQDLPLVATFSIAGENQSIDSISSTTYHETEGVAVDIEAILDQTFGKSKLSYAYQTGRELPKMQRYLREGTQIESENQDAMEELLRIFRFTKWEKNQYRFGLSLNTVPRVVQVFLQPIMKLTANWESFGQSGMTQFESRLSKETGYVLIIKENPTAEDYLLAGELMSKLSHDMDGYTIRPAVQLLEDIEGMEQIGESFQAEYGGAGEVLLILGVKPKVAPGAYESVRHQVEDLVIQRPQ